MRRCTSSSPPPHAPQKLRETSPLWHCGVSQAGWGRRLAVWSLHPFAATIPHTPARGRQVYCDTLRAHLLLPGPAAPWWTSMRTEAEPLHSGASWWRWSRTTQAVQVEPLPSPSFPILWLAVCVGGWRGRERGCRVGDRKNHPILRRHEMPTERSRKVAVDRGGDDMEGYEATGRREMLLEIGSPVPS